MTPPGRNILSRKLRARRRSSTPAIFLLAPDITLVWEYLGDGEYVIGIDQ